MKIVLLAGGSGTRISEETEYKPKPMVEIGGMPILWHIMKEYSFHGFDEFIICAGYKQQIIKEWFRNYFLYTSDITFDLTQEYKMVVHDKRTEPWKVTVVDTGLSTMTGGRVKRVQRYIGEETFMLTYGDGVCDVDIRRLLDFHKSHGKLATITSVMVEQQKGILDIDNTNSVRSFREKSVKDRHPINAGYMVLEPGIFAYLENDNTSLEFHVLEKLSKEGQLMSYQHQGFWQCMDTMAQKKLLETMWAEGNPAWKKW